MCWIYYHVGMDTMAREQMEGCSVMLKEVHTERKEGMLDALKGRNYLFLFDK